MVQSKEEEPTLFMVTASMLSVFPNFDSKSTEAIDSGVAWVSLSVRVRLIPRKSFSRVWQRHWLES